MKAAKHAFTVDVEDWHNATVLQYSGVVSPPTRAVDQNVKRLLELCAEHDVRGTWFFLGEVAEVFPHLVEAVVDEGHEVGVHGYHHHQIGALPQKEFRASIARAKDTVEQAGGAQVLGYRAVDFSINRSTWYALDDLLELGFSYDASLFPMKTPRYGMTGIAGGSQWLRTDAGQWIFEVPVTLGSFARMPVPFAGGGYFRLMPFFLSAWFARRAARKGPVVFYFHPCEIERGSRMQPLPDGVDGELAQKIEAAFLSQIRGRAHGERKLKRLFTEFAFCPIREVFKIDELTLPTDEARKEKEADR